MAIPTPIDINLVNGMSTLALMKHNIMVHTRVDTLVMIYLIKISSYKSNFGYENTRIL
jgi:hypothetical protein